MRWQRIYVFRLASHGLSVDEAIEIYLAGLSSHDYADDPEDAADEELSLWASDG